MTKRQLNEDEKKLCEFSLKRLTAELEYEQYLVDYTDLMLNCGLKLNYKREVRSYIAKQKNASDNAERLLKTIDEVKDQIANGVTIKETKEDK